MQLGMIGLGRMGSSMVRRLLKAGHPCVVYDVHPEEDVVHHLDPIFAALAPGIEAAPRTDGRETLRRAPLCSWILQKSQVERSEHQDDSYIHHQPFPEPVPEEQ